MSSLVDEIPVVHNTVRRTHMKVIGCLGSNVMR